MNDHSTRTVPRGQKEKKKRDAKTPAREGLSSEGRRKESDLGLRVSCAKNVISVVNTVDQPRAQDDERKQGEGSMR